MTAGGAGRSRRRVSERPRCGWEGTDPLYVRYHDTEWGVPCHDDRELFEKLLLDGAQAGLSWITILRKRPAYRKAFHRFNPKLIAGYTTRDVRRLMNDAGIVRNRLKIEAFIANARAFLALKNELGSFDRYLWSFTGGRTIVNKRRSIGDIPPSTPEAEAMSKDLRLRGFKFVGPTICYAFMQACGLVNDHVTTCFRHREV